MTTEWEELNDMAPGGGRLSDKQASPRATVPTDSLNIAIASISHYDQRYDTCGDWFASPFGGLQIRVSAELPRREQFLVAIHELIEAFLCECAGVTGAQVDAFDTIDFRGETGDPGDYSRAPYYRQHQFATGIERLLAAETQVNWLEYEQHVAELSRT